MTDSMSDEEIRENLLKLGVNIGPVVDSTRAFYRKKLAKLLGEIKDEPVSHGSDTEGSASENEMNEEKEDQVEEKLFSDTYLPPTQIRGRRSVNSFARHSPVKSSYHGETLVSSNPPALTSDKRNLVMVLCFVVGCALILYFTLFQGDSTEIVVGSN